MAKSNRKWEWENGFSENLGLELKKEPPPPNDLPLRFSLIQNTLNFFLQFSAGQEVVLCSCAEKIQVLNVESGKVTQTIYEVKTTLEHLKYI